MLPITYTADRDKMERILLAAARDALATMQSRFALSDAGLSPAVYWRITDNWLELSLRFLVRHRGIRDTKNRMSRDILTGLDAAGTGIASATYEIVGLPTVHLEDRHDPPDLRHSPLERRSPSAIVPVAERLSGCPGHHPYQLTAIQEEIRG